MCKFLYFFLLILSLIILSRLCSIVSSSCGLYSIWKYACDKSLFSFFSSANKCLLKVATYAAQLEQYQKAIEIYEQVG